MAEVGAEIWAIVTLLSGATETQKVRYRSAIGVHRHASAAALWPIVAGFAISVADFVA
jgi:hypothetical protein